MANYNLAKELEKIDEELIDHNYTLGKGLLQPFRASNSGSRAVMQATQSEQFLSLMHPSPPIVVTGYENRYMENSSNFIKSNANYTVIDKIFRYSFNKNNNKSSILILLDPESNTLHYIDNSRFQYVSECYGYRMNTDYLDLLSPGDLIPEGAVIRKANNANKYNNYQGGVNLTCMYTSYGATTEDPTVLSESAAKKFTSPLFDTIQIMINDNDILLNLYGGDNTDEYKAFPDIGEDVENGILCAIRREKKTEEALFSQSWNQLKDYMISDEKYSISGGTVIDIVPYCNNPEALRTSIYNQQILKYYEETVEYSRNIINCVKPLLARGLNMTNELSALYSWAIDTVNEVKHMGDSVFNGILLEITVMRIIPLLVGDKITDRYGGKGVVSKILPDHEMPQVQNLDGIWEPIDILYNKCTCVNRLNPGQLFETSITAYGSQIVEFIYTNMLDNDTAADMIYRYLNILVPDEAREFKETYDSFCDEDKEIFIKSYIDDGVIYVVTKPITGSITLDTLKQLKHEFPEIEVQKAVMVNMKDSSGNIRKIMTNNKHITIGRKYIYRLKQIAEEKFSVVSLAATNIRGENTKSKSYKQHKTIFSSTPVRFGEMEFGDFLHMLDAILVDSQLMRISSSPIGRAQHEDLLTGNPFVADIKLNTDARSRPVEIVNAYLKTIGLKLVINKRKKNNLNVAYVPYTIKPKAKQLMDNICQHRPFDITDEQAKYIVDKFDEFTGRDEKFKGTSEEVEFLNSVRYKYEAAKLANMAIEQYGISSVEELIDLIEKNSIEKEMEHIVMYSTYTLRQKV